MKKYGCGDRAGEIARKRNSEKWQAAMREYSAMKAEESLGEASLSEPTESTNDLERARLAKAQLWNQYVIANAALNKSLEPASRNADLAEAYRKAASGLYKDWQSACKWLETLERTHGAVVPVDRFDEFRRDGIRPLSGVVMELPNYLSSRVASFDSVAVTEAVEEWLDKEWNKAIDGLVGSFEACFRT